MPTLHILRLHIPLPMPCKPTLHTQMPRILIRSLTQFNQLTPKEPIAHDTTDSSGI
jgi:hypothetical protein